MNKSANEFNTVITMAKPSVGRKPSVSKYVPINTSANFKIRTVITKLNSPNVIIVIGNENSLIIGFTVAFKNPRSITKIKA